MVIWSYLRRTYRRFLELEALLDLWKGHKSSIVPFEMSIIQNWNAVCGTVADYGMESIHMSVHYGISFVEFLVGY